jgi:hypothetical protein
MIKLVTELLVIQKLLVITIIHIKNYTHTHTQKFKNFFYRKSTNYHIIV